MTLQRGGTNRMRGARNPHVHGHLFNGRTILYDPDPARALPDWECMHGRLPGDSSEPCGCWEQEPCPDLMAVCGGCAELSPVDAVRCVGCGRKLGVTR